MGNNGIYIGMSFGSATTLNAKFKTRKDLKADYMRREAEGGISDRTLYIDKKDNSIHAEYTAFSGGDVADYNKKHNTNYSVNKFCICGRDGCYMDYSNQGFNINGKDATDLSYDYVRTSTQYAKDLNGNHKVDKEEVFWFKTNKRVYE